MGDHIQKLKYFGCYLLYISKKGANSTSQAKYTHCVVTS